MIKAIIFDSDDTLIQFSKVAAPCLQKAAKELGLRIPNKKEINKLWSRQWEYLSKKLWPEADNKKLREAAFKYYKKNENKFKEVKGAIKTLNFLRKKYILSVVSAKSGRGLERQFKLAKIPIKNFKFMHSAEDTKFHKPNPRVFDKAIKNFKNLKRNEILYVGDTLLDYKAAKGAKFEFVAVLTGYYKKKDFLKSGLKKENILKSVKYLPKWLEKNG
jgi:HAD superfamily hydrolase (TIGR01662 family)